MSEGKARQEFAASRIQVCEDHRDGQDYFTCLSALNTVNRGYLVNNK